MPQGGPGGMMPPDGQMPAFDGTSMPEFDGTMMPQGGPGGMTPPDGQMPEFDGTSMPEFDGTMMPQGGPGGMMPPDGQMGGPGFDQRQEEAEEEEEAVISTAKPLSEFGPETWLHLSASVIILAAALLFALKFRRY